MILASPYDDGDLRVPYCFRVSTICGRTDPPLSHDGVDRLDVVDAVAKVYLFYILWAPISVQTRHFVAILGDWCVREVESIFFGTVGPSYAFECFN